MFPPLVEQEDKNLERFYFFNSFFYKKLKVYKRPPLNSAITGHLANCHRPAIGTSLVCKRFLVMQMA